MKKVVLIFCIAALMSTNAYAADINANVTFRKIHVEVTNTDGVEIPTIQLLDEKKTKVLYNDEGTFDGTGYVFDDFSFPADEVTGNYIVRVGEDDKITETTVYYSSFSDITNTLEEINKNKGNAFSIICSNARIFGVSEADLNSLNDKWKQRLENDIKALNIDCSNDENIQKGYFDVVSATNKILNYSNLTNSTDSQKIKDAVNKVDGLDLKFWDTFDDKSKLQRGFAAQNMDELSVGDEDIKKLFDGAMLTAVINSADWKSGKDALTYYVNKGLLSVDSKYLNSGADVFKALKEKNIANYNDIPTAIKQIYDNQNNNNTPGGGGGGGGGTSSPKTPSNIIPDKSNNQDNNNQDVFNDLGNYDWAKDAIEALYKAGVVSGKDKGIFAPQDNVTRAEFVKMIVNAFKLLDVNAAADFEDVPDDSWCYEYVASAKKAGIISGISDDYFGASEQISRQDMAVILSRVIDLFNLDIQTTKADFSDYSDISDYAKNAVSRLASAGIVNGMGDGTYSPKTNVTRAQGAKVIYSLMQRKGQ